jgi:hypothetical protein
MSTRPRTQQLRDKRKAVGLCIHCGEPAIVKTGRILTSCQICTDRAHDNRRRYAERDESLGVCRNAGCSNKVTIGKKHCDICNKKSGQRSTKRRQKHVEGNLCADCHKVPPVPGITRCVACRQRLSESVKRLQDKRIKEGRCGRCGKNPSARPGYSNCQSCIDERRQVHTDLKLLCLNAYCGPICAGCGDDEVEVLQIDHIAGGGHRHALTLGDGNASRGRAKMYRHLRDAGFPLGYRVLCASCNIRAARGIPFPLERIKGRKKD